MKYIFCSLCNIFCDILRIAFFYVGKIRVFRGCIKLYFSCYMQIKNLESNSGAVFPVSITERVVLHALHVFEPLGSLVRTLQ